MVEWFSDIQVNVSMMLLTFPFFLVAPRSQRAKVGPPCPKQGESYREKGRAQPILFYE